MGFIVFVRGQANSQKKADEQGLPPVAVNMLRISFLPYHEIES